MTWTRRIWKQEQEEQGARRIKSSPMVMIQILLLDRMEGLVWGEGGRGGRTVVRREEGRTTRRMTCSATGMA